MIISIILLIVGFIILIKGADIFVDGASSVAKNFNLSKMLIGLTIVAFGTSAPEFAVSIKSLLSGNGDMVLGNVINAQLVDGIWKMASGIRINPTVASTSLLKGIAISGIGSAAIVAPLVVGVKNLVQKMNMATLKEKLKVGQDKLKEGKDKTVGVAKDAKKKVTDKVIEKKVEVKSSVEQTKEKVKEKVAVPKGKAVQLVENAKSKYKLEQHRRNLIKKFNDSGMSLEEFAKENKLSKEEIGLLMYYEVYDFENENTEKEGKTR